MNYGFIWTCGVKFIFIRILKLFYVDLNLLVNYLILYICKLLETKYLEMITFENA